MANHGARIYRTTDKSLSAGWTAIDCDASRWDTDGYYNAAAPTRLTIPNNLDGLYYLWTNAHTNYTFASPWNSVQGVGLRLNGSTFLARRLTDWNVATPQYCSTLYQLNAGDYIEACVYVAQASTAFAYPNYSVEFAVQRLEEQTAHHGARVKRNTNYAVPRNTWTPIPFDGEVYDTDAFHDNASNNTRLTIPAGLDGVYVIGGSWGFENQANAELRTAIMLNGATYIAYRFDNRLNPSDAHTLETIYQLSAGDYVELYVYYWETWDHWLLRADHYSPHFWLTRLG